jgi:hypothetical protein
MGRAKFKSAPARVVLMLTRSREKWKGRVAAKQREIRRLRVKVRDLEVSRQSWKRRALAQTVAPSPPEDLGPGKAPAKPR